MAPIFNKPFSGWRIISGLLIKKGIEKLLDSFAFQLNADFADLTVNPEGLLELLLFHWLEIDDEYLLFAGFQSPQSVQNGEPGIKNGTRRARGACRNATPWVGCCCSKPPTTVSAAGPPRSPRSLSFV